MASSMHGLEYHANQTPLDLEDDRILSKRPAVAVWTGVSLEVMLAMWTEAIVSTWSDDGHIHSTRRT
jgi:hypothetical protein